MKKSFIAIGLIIAIAFIGMPYVTGKVAETASHQLVDNINSDTVKNGKTTILSYERGYRSSQSTYQYELPAFLNEMMDIGAIEYECTSQHGITSVDYHCQLSNKGAYGEFVKEFLAGTDPLSVFGSVSAFGSIDQTIAIEPVALDMSDQNAGVINLKKSAITLESNKEFKSFVIEGAINGLSITNNEESFDVGTIKMSGDLDKIAKGLFVGDSALSIANAKINGKEVNGEINDIKITTDTKDQGETVSSQVLFNAGNVDFEGSGLDSVKDVSINVDIAGLNKEALIDYYQAMSDLESSLLAAASNNDIEAAESAAGFAQLTPKIEAMLQAGLNAKVDMSAKVNGDKNTVALDLGLMETLTFGDAMAFAFAPESALEKINVKVASKLNKTLLEAQPQFGSYIQYSPLVINSGDDYTLDLSLGKKIALNGKSMTFTELQQVLMTGVQ